MGRSPRPPAPDGRATDPSEASPPSAGRSEPVTPYSEAVKRLRVPPAKGRDPMSDVPPEDSGASPGMTGVFVDKITSSPLDRDPEGRDAATFVEGEEELKVERSGGGPDGRCTDPCEHFTP